eukprot:jgi/Bigna1/75893/fgenesh1_pg.37_\
MIDGESLVELELRYIFELRLSSQWRLAGNLTTILLTDNDAKPNLNSKARLEARMASRIPRGGVTSSTRGKSSYDPTAYAKKMAEKRARAQKLREERKAKASENAAKAAQREAARRSQFESLSKTGTFEQSSENLPSNSASTASLSARSSTNAEKENRFNATPGRGSVVIDQETKNLIESLLSRVKALESALSSQKTELESSITDLRLSQESRQRQTDRRIKALEKENSVLKRKIKEIRTTPSSSSSPAHASAAAPASIVEEKVVATKPKAAEKKQVKKNPTSAKSSPPFASNNISSIGGRGVKEPVAAKRPPIANLDDMPVGGSGGADGQGINPTVNLDELPVGGGAGLSGGPSPFGAAAGGMSGLGSGSGNPPVDPFGPAVPVQLHPCPHCGRKFNKNALARHLKLKVCLKKRKPMKVTVLDGDTAKASKEAQRNNRSSNRKFERLQKKKEEQKKIPKWKLQRMQLQEAMKAGRQIKEALASGKSLADLPPPTSSVPDGRVACSNCGRKFNEDRIAKHMSICKKINKGKGGVKKKAGSARSRVGTRR